MIDKYHKINQTLFVKEYKFKLYFCMETFWSVTNVRNMNSLVYLNMIRM